MDKPYFDEETQTDKAIKWSLIVITGVLVLEGIIVSIIQGLDSYHHQYLAFVAILLLLCIPPGFLYRWYKRDEMEIKFLYVVVFFLIVIWLTCGLVNVIVFYPSPPAPKAEFCDNTQGFIFYNVSGTVKCMPCVGSNTCITFNNATNTFSCQTDCASIFTNCSLCTPPPNPPPPPPPTPPPNGSISLDISEKDYFQNYGIRILTDEETEEAPFRD
eukprot:TRINITY_DN17734_c0_g1_i1.p1 TRINITY_DN17734_c0_g1~~TRINITY_DN17734_c0_g1_i1.p1  ORF type:complete len:215 (-),score=28.36 TRINITY_DN17734_c0_g1_i1:94-738(-)